MESLQQFILEVLDKNKIIEDTRTLQIPGDAGPASSNDAQITILGALNSLSSRDVRRRTHSFAYYFDERQASL
jgi:phenylalanyl-tRNA synthetase alpha chain